MCIVQLYTRAMMVLLYVTDTSRSPRDGEVNGVDYHFVSRATFEKDIADSRFVEYGQLEKNFYGTTMDSIRQIIAAGKVCVLNLYPQVRLSRINE